MTTADSNAFVVQVVNPASVLTGLDFPVSTWNPSGACRFTFSNPLPAYPATYIWECLPRRQKGFYTTFFWASDDGSFHPDRTYYGAHPYPDPRGSWDAYQEPPPLGATDGHRWEIAVDGGDILGARVQYDRWFVQVLRVRTQPSGRRFHEYFYDVAGSSWQPGTPFTPSLTALVSYESGAFVDPTSRALVFGDAPWNMGNEVYNGLIRGIRVYTTDLGDADLLQEVAQPASSANGRSTLWYLKMNPDPSDLSCDPIPGRANAGPAPVWSTARRATLWQP